MPFGTQWTSQTTLPWMNQLYRNLGENSAVLLNSPYIPYAGKRMPYQSPQLNAAHRYALNTKLYEPSLNQAQNYIGQGTQAFPQHVQQYMNPYLQHVLNNISHYGNRNFQENILPALESQFVSLGQHGGGHHQRLAQRATRDLGESIAREQNAALAHGYGEANKNFNLDQARMLQGAESQANLGRMRQAGNIADVSTLQEVGKDILNRDQQALDTDYQNFLNQKHYPEAQLARHSALLQGLPSQGQTQTVAQTPGKSELNTAGNLGALAGNLYGARLATGRKKGGSVQTRKPFGLSCLTFRKAKKSRR